MKPVNTPVAIQLEVVASTSPRLVPHPAPPAPQRSLLRRRLAGAERIEAVLKPEAAATLIDLRQRSGRTYSAIIEGLLLPEHARDVRKAG